MKITARMMDAVKQFKQKFGEWPKRVGVGHKELQELNDHFGYCPSDIRFMAEEGWGEVQVSIVIFDSESELVCSING